MMEEYEFISVTLDGRNGNYIHRWDTPYHCDVLTGRQNSWKLSVTLKYHAEFTQHKFIEFEVTSLHDVADMTTIKLDNIQVYKSSSNVVNFPALKLVRKDKLYGNMWCGPLKYPIDVTQLRDLSGYRIKGCVVVSYPLPSTNKVPSTSVLDKPNKAINSGAVQSGIKAVVSTKESMDFAKKLLTDMKSDLVQDMKKMYEESAAWDVKFILDDGELKAHKCVLVSRSPVFAAMFEHPMKEQDTNEIPIHDIELHTFDCFLLFLYTGEIEDQSWATVMELYGTASKYQVPSLQKLCSKILGDGLTIDNACTVLVQSDIHNDEELKKKTKKFLRDHFKDIGSTKEWVDVAKNLPVLATEVILFITASNI